MTKRLTSLFIALQLWGCAQITSINYETSPRERKPNDYGVEILDSRNITRPYKVIAVIYCSGGLFDNDNDIVDRIRKEAKKLGGDALIDLDKKAISYFSGSAVKVLDFVLFDTIVDTEWEAKVIVWEDGEVNPESQFRSSSRRADNWVTFNDRAYNS